LLAAVQAIVTEAEDGDFGDAIPSTIWAIIEDDIKPVLARIQNSRAG